MEHHNIQEYIAAIREYTLNNYRKMLREPDGYLKYNFIVPEVATKTLCGTGIVT